MSVKPAWLPSIPYPPSRLDGYWAPVTATLNWCEEKYYATHYSAEIVNSLTNLTFIALAFKGISNCAKHGHDRIFLITFCGYLIVGSGSFAFHSTLKYPMQLVDELSMIYTTCLMCWATFEHRRPVWFKIVLAFSVAGLALFITLYYHYLQDPTFHQVAYAVLTAVVLLRSMYVMELNLRPSLNRTSEAPHANGRPRTSTEEAERQRQAKRDAQILRRMWWMIATGLSVFLGGFAIWNLDNMYCSTLRRWRHDLGLPWGILLEGHGWWHLMTGVGAYFYIVWGIWLRHCLNGRQDEYEMLWPSLLTSLPQVVRRNSLDAKGYGNGSLKKSN